MKWNLLLTMNVKTLLICCNIFITLLTFSVSAQNITDCQNTKTKYLDDYYLNELEQLTKNKVDTSEISIEYLISLCEDHPSLKSKPKKILDIIYTALRTANKLSDRLNLEGFSLFLNHLSIKHRSQVNEKFKSYLITNNNVVSHELFFTRLKENNFPSDLLELIRLPLKINKNNIFTTLIDKLKNNDKAVWKNTVQTINNQTINKQPPVFNDELLADIAAICLTNSMCSKATHKNTPLASAINIITKIQSPKNSGGLITIILAIKNQLPTINVLNVQKRAIQINTSNLQAFKNFSEWIDNNTDSIQQLDNLKKEIELDFTKSSTAIANKTSYYTLLNFLNRLAIRESFNKSFDTTINVEDTLRTVFVAIFWEGNFTVAEKASALTQLSEPLYRALNNGWFLTKSIVNDFYTNNMLILLNNKDLLNALINNHPNKYPFNIWIEDNKTLTNSTLNKIKDKKKATDLNKPEIPYRFVLSIAQIAYKNENKFTCPWKVAPESFLQENDWFHTTYPTLWLEMLNKVPPHCSPASTLTTTNQLLKQISYVKDNLILFTNDAAIAASIAVSTNRAITNNVDIINWLNSTLTIYELTGSDWLKNNNVKVDKGPNIFVAPMEDTKLYQPTKRNLIEKRF